ADSLGKGSRVIVNGRLRQFDWETDQGENRSMLTLEVDDIGPSLRFATAKTQKRQSNGSTGNGAAQDPWNASAKQQGEEPPF
ncbi:single-stranded DNA-binding protein, partial [Streptomyces daliensis]|nr:single-stranded DNA-binding protein [Streptomyces daliensis]